MPTDTLPDTEGALVTWLKGRSAVSAIVGARVFFGVPKGATEASYPMLVVFRVGGTDDVSDVPIDNALVQIDCWGSFGASGFGKKAECTALKNAVRAELKALTQAGSTTIAPGVDAHGMTVESDLWAPDPADDRPRYSLTVAVTASNS